MHERYLLIHPEWGIFLGTMWGMGWWSKLDSVGQLAANVFDEPDQIHKFVDTFEYKPQEYDVEKVLTKDPEWATIEEIEAMGLEAWVPD